MSIPYYRQFLSPTLIEHLISVSEPVVGIPDLVVAKGLQTEFAHIEHADALRFVCDLYERKKPHLEQILAQRTIDRRLLIKSRQCNKN